MMKALSFLPVLFLYFSFLILGQESEQGPSPHFSRDLK